MLSSEFIIIDNPFGDNTEPVTGVFLLNQKYVIFLLANTILKLYFRFQFIHKWKTKVGTLRYARKITRSI